MHTGLLHTTKCFGGGSSPPPKKNSLPGFPEEILFGPVSNSGFIYFRDKKDSLQCKIGRGHGRVSELLAFTSAESTSTMMAICQKGLMIEDNSTWMVLGGGKYGVYVCRHADVVLDRQGGEVQELIMYKVSTLAVTMLFDIQMLQLVGLWLSLDVYHFHVFLSRDIFLANVMFHCHFDHAQWITVWFKLKKSPVYR